MKKIATYTKALLFTLAAMLTAQVIFAQDIRNTQSFSNPLKLNPALMGANTDLKMMMNYTSQWKAIDDGYKSYSLNLLYPVFIGTSSDAMIKSGSGKNDANSIGNKLDFGFCAQNNMAGAFKNMDFSLSIGYNKFLSQEHYLSVAITGGYVQKSLDVTNLTFDDQYILGSYNSSNPTNESILKDKISYPDVGFGLLWYYNPNAKTNKINAYFGISGYHMNKPNESFISGNGFLPPKYACIGGVKIIGGNKIDITPNIRYVGQNSSQELAAGLYLDYRFSEKAKLTIGSWYRRQDAIAFLMGFEHKNFSLGYSYDVVTSEIAKVISGVDTHNISVSIKLNQSEKKNIKIYSTPVPEF